MVVDLTAILARKRAGLPAFDNAGLPAWAPPPVVLSIAGWHLDDRVCFQWGTSGKWLSGQIRKLTEPTMQRPSQAYVSVDGVAYVVPVRDLREWEGQRL